MWASLIPIIANYGLQFAESLWTKWTSGANPTAQDWADLTALAQNTARTQLLAALQRANIPVTDPHAVALLTQVPQ